MPRSRLLVALFAAVALAPAAAATADAAVIGLADQNASAYADARLRALKLPVARLVVPYDAATSQPQAVVAWLAAVHAAGMQPHVAFEHLKANGCPGSPCIVPTRAQYAAAVRAFIARFPQVRIYTTWNEANHESQPVSGRPEMVAAYYEELKAACPTCTVVAGDVLDSGGYIRWLERFQQATDTKPQLWGLHNYGDVTYATTEGTDAVLRTVEGQLWIEETGGIVVLRNSAGRITLSFDEARAAASIDRAFAIVAARPRITRMYIYHWQSGPTSRFDAGLIRPDGSLRPSYAAMQRGIAGQPAPSATTPATTSSTLKWTAAWSEAQPAYLLLRAHCTTSGGRCVGKVATKLRTRRTTRSAVRLATVGTARTYRTSSTKRTQTLRVRVSKSLRRRLRASSTRQLRLNVRPTTPSGSAATITLRLAKPR